MPLESALVFKTIKRSLPLEEGLRLCVVIVTCTGEVLGALKMKFCILHPSVVGELGQLCVGHLRIVRMPM